MKKWFISGAGLLLFLLSITACQEKEEVRTGSLELVFKGTFGAEPLYMFDRTYDYLDNTRIKWQMFQFFLSDLELISDDTGLEPQMLSLVESVSFSDIQSESEALEGFKLRFNDIEVGNYSGIQFGLGVSPELNATQPSDYDPSEPLAAISSYWEAASSYIFTKIEGNADLDGDGQFGEDDEKITYHQGANDLFEKRSLPYRIEIQENNTTSVVINVNLLKALDNESTGEHIDFRQTPRDHHTNPEVYSFIIPQLRENAISIGN
ncbi:MAG: MbnP family protein [Saprospiraceae bacterium]|nr:hypothetical protein [Lewinella sp.]